MKKLGAVVAGVIVVFPFAASAVTADELQAQLSALLNQTKAIQTDTSYQATLGTGECPSLSRNLKYGSSGSDVTSLQNYLAQDPTVYPEGKVTGYYGSLTEAAVKRWQSIHSVVSSGTPATTGYGVVGPATRAAIAQACAVPAGAAQPVGGTINAAPAAGQAPMAVTIHVSVNTTNSCAAQMYTLNFGDGTAVQPIPSAAGICQPQSLVITHVYQYGGQYQLTLGANGHETSAAITVFGLTQSGATATSTGLYPGTVDPKNGLLVQISDNAFTPSTFSIKPGTKVTWTNVGTAAHTVTSDDGAFDSGSLAQGQSYSLVFDQLGTYRYYCKFHGNKGGLGMSGLIIVTQTAQSTTGPTSSFSYAVPTVTTGSARAVTLAFNTRGSCDGYSIDWGDDSSPKLVGGDGGQCGTPNNVSLTHTYQQSGTFTITLSRGPGLYHTDTPSVTIQ